MLKSLTGVEGGVEKPTVVNSAPHSNLYSDWPVPKEAISKLSKDVQHLKLSQTNKKLCLSGKGTISSTASCF